MIILIYTNNNTHEEAVKSLNDINNEHIFVPYFTQRITLFPHRYLITQVYQLLSFDTHIILNKLSMGYNFVCLGSNNIVIAVNCGES